MTEGASTSRAVIAKHDTTANQPWIEKYRPQTLDDVAANKEIVGTIKRLTDENRLPHLLLYGPPGLIPQWWELRLMYSDTVQDVIMYWYCLHGPL